jgi:hypothetical protein
MRMTVSKATLELARLDAAAQGAGAALACVHQTAEEFHHALIRNYLALHPRRSPFVATVVVALVALVLVLI